MVFSEPAFLFFFLPLVVAAYFSAPTRLRDWLLLLASLFFYTWGEDEYVAIIVAMILFNFGTGIALAATPQPTMRRLVLTAGIAGNISVLVFFKYAYFLASSLTSDAELLELTSSIHLPIGISFFTFQSLTYLIDLYRGEIAVQRNPMKLALYISLFPQLIAGPIVRYSEIERALAGRTTRIDDFIAGTQRFVVGLAKKTLIADPLGLVADQVFGLPADGLSSAVVWVGLVCYSLQIFFDFSAYSDMAIGLGRIFGFSFPENFNYPYVAQSVTEFWQRWHMTLSRWFRDYLYIPLGGNRAGTARTYLNLWIVFIVCGLWHGASWNFVIWGMYYGVLLVIERMVLSRWLGHLPRILRHAYLLLVVMIGWVPFRAETLDQTLVLLRFMFVPSAADEATLYPIERFVDGYVVFAMLLGVVFSMPIARLRLRSSRGATPSTSSTFGWLGAPRPAAAAATLLLLLASVIMVGAASYSPFIYFRF